MEKGWTTNPDKAFLPSEITDAKWYTLPVTWEVRNEIPEEAGLYIYSAELNFPNNNLFHSMKTVMYAGKASVSIQQRYIDHWRKHLFVECRKAYKTNFLFHYMKTTDKNFISNIKSFEQKLINVYGPSINQINSEIEES